MQRKFISRHSFLKCAGMGAVTAAAAGLLAGCGGSDSSSSSTASSAAAAEPADPNKPYAGVTLYYAATDTEATGPEMQDIVAMVKEKRGYSIVAFTDHRHYGWHPELMDDTFIPIAAYEADLNGPFPPSGSFQWVKTYHLNFYDTDPAARGGFTAVQPPQQYGDLEALNGFIARMNAGGFLCCYNHPYWSLQNYNDYAGLKGAFAMEIYNHGCELDGLYGYAPQAYDEMLRAGQKLFCVATDDNHDTYAPGDPRCDSFGGFTMFKLEKLTYASVIEALKKGDFYASTGPELQELYIRDGALCVRCSPVEKIYVVTSGRRCLMKLAAPGETLTEAVFPLNGDEGYVRVDCRDGQGRHAYSNAYWLDE